MSAPLRFDEVDVFTNNGLEGNPLAVVHGADGLSTQQMQQVANWTNFSETTFLQAPTDPAADYLVRIFTPFEELPFAGHPTVGSAHAWLEEGGVPSSPDVIVQQCGIGLVTLRNVLEDGTRLGFESPPLIRSGPVDPKDRERIMRIMNLDASQVTEIEWIENGPPWVGIELADGVAISEIEPRHPDGGPLVVAVFAVGSERDGVDVEVRCFFGEGNDIREDPVTGSANASIARYLKDKGRVQFPYVAAQGVDMGRNGRVYVSADDDERLWIAGDARTIVSGTITVQRP